jgi:hypothetical protein
VLSKIEAQRPLRFSEKKERFFQWLISTNYAVGTPLDLFGVTEEGDLQALAAWTECSNNYQTTGFARLLRSEGIVAEAGGLEELTPNGFRLLENAETGGAQTNQAFVAMWFGQVTRPIYDDAIAPAITAAGFRPVRIDRKEHSNKIDDEIIAEIRRSRFVVADFTCGLFEVDGLTRAEARGGVYYEAGFAQGLGTPVIWTVSKNCMEFVHFDVRQFAHIVWEDAEGFRRALYNRIAAVIGILAGAPGLPANQG